MKTSVVTDSPTLACRLVRTGRALFSADAAADEGFGARHLASCPDCQAFFGAVDELEFSLRREAATGRAPVPRGLDERIIQAVHASRAPRPRKNLALPFLSFASVAAAVALTVAYVQRSAGPGAASSRPAAIAGANVLPADLWTTLPSAATAALQRENPLQNEANAVYADAKSALQFLALNFLPPVQDTAAARNG
jgi:predicted anti-sigma-YlaC factor YlaD